jgi:mRNA-degrading endonuclease RelE of RelBE toxin-antitoxin system
MWRIEWEKKARKSLNKLDPPVKDMILEYLEDLLKEIPYPNPQDSAKPLTNLSSGLDGSF